MPENLPTMITSKASTSKYCFFCGSTTLWFCITRINFVLYHKNLLHVAKAVKINDKVVLMRNPMNNKVIFV